MNNLRSAADEIGEKTDGRVSFKFYGGGVMGDDNVVLRKIRARQLHGGIVQTGPLSNQVPVVSLYNLPMKFQSFEEIKAVRSKYDETLITALRDRGFETLGIPGLGFAYALSTKEAQSLKKARNLKIWVPKGDRLSARILNSFGINAVPLSPVDVLTGLQTGLIDTIAAPPVSVVALQWHTQVSYLVDIPFMYIYSLFIVDSRRFNQLSQEDQEVVRDVFKAAVALSEAQNIKDHQETWEVLVSRGIEILTPNAAERKDWQLVASAGRQSWVDNGIVPEDVYEGMTNILDEVRAN